MRTKRFLAPALLAVLTAGLLVQLPAAIADRASAYDLFDPIIDIRHVLRENFADPDKLDDEKMRQAMIAGLLETLGDPYTEFVPPADLAEFDKDIRGTYVGIGCEVNIVDDRLTIVSPMDGSPALVAGVMAGDVVLEIEGQDTLKMPVEECIKRLMGEPGTVVNIKVRHLDGSEMPLAITRGHIVTRTVKGVRRNGGEHWSYCVDDKLGLSYVRVTQFNESTMGELNEALKQIQSSGLNGLILDLRDNPGGALFTAVQMADLFLEQGQIVSVRTRPGKGEPEISYAQRAGTLPNFPMLVLVNGQSASASEIVSGALQENGRAKVMGTRTFGKGSVQELRELDYNRGTLKYTAALYYLPSGRNITRDPDGDVWGVDPDPGLVFAVSDDDYIAMVRTRRDYEIIRNGESNGSVCATPQWVRENMKDEHLAKAIEVLKTRVTGGNWPAVSEEDSAQAAFSLELKRAVDRRGDLIEALQQVEGRIGELHDLSAKAGKAPLLPPEVDLAQGTITIRDKHGNVIGTYKIEGGNLELALDSMQLTPVE